MKRFRFRLPAYLIALPILVTSAYTSAQQAGAPLLVVMKGRAVCLGEKGQKEEGLFQCSGQRFGFVDKESKLYTFLATDSASAVFADARVRNLDLQITARLHDADRLELIKFQATRDGKLYDIYYFCEVCNIRAYAPGLCPCCRDELELRETPAK